MLMQSSQSDKLPAASDETVKKMQSSFDFEGNHTFKLPPLKLLTTRLNKEGAA